VGDGAIARAVDAIKIIQVIHCLVRYLGMKGVGVYVDVHD
jgi:hypothetical protein